MTEGWGMVVAAAIGVIGVLCGLFIGRRTVRDQALVEHKQWLRGQSQEAYVALLAEWDKLLPQFSGHLLSLEELHDVASSNVVDEASDAVEQLAVDLIEPFVLAAERVHMLGPGPVDEAANAMSTTAADLATSLVTQHAPPQGEGPYAAFHRAMGVTASVARPS